MKNHLEWVRFIHEWDLTAGFGTVYLPFALARKYPNTETEWNWQYVFPVLSISQHQLLYECDDGGGVHFSPT